MINKYSKIFINKKTLYILSTLLILLTFNIFSFFGKSKFKSYHINNSITDNININEQDLLETARLQLQSSHKNYHDFENRRYNGIEIICNNNNKILYSIDLEKYGPSPNEDPTLINDYQIIYIGLKKESEYYYEDYFASEEQLDKHPLDKEHYCDE